MKVDKQALDEACRYRGPGKEWNRKGIIDEISYSEVSTVFTGKFIYFTGTISNM